MWPGIKAFRTRRLQPMIFISYIENRGASREALKVMSDAYALFIKGDNQTKENLSFKDGFIFTGRNGANCAVFSYRLRRSPLHKYFGPDPEPSFSKPGRKIRLTVMQTI